MTTLPLFGTPTLEAQTLSHSAFAMRLVAGRSARVVGTGGTGGTGGSGHGKALFRVMLCTGGAPLSVAMVNCGAYGWVSDARLYSYSATDPDTGLSWPAMPAWL